MSKTRTTAFSTRIQLGLLLLIAAVGFLGGCAREDKPRIGLSLDTLKEERWQRDRDTFIAKAEELGAEVIVQSANSDDIRQVRDVEALITRGVDVLVIVPHNGAAMTNAVKAANEAGIPVIAYDRLILDADIDYYLTFDNEKVGEAQARYVMDRMPENRPGRIVRIYGAPTDNNAKMFKKGQDDVLASFIDESAVEVVFEDWALDWRPDVAKKIMNAAITKVGHDFDAVLVTNDGTAGGAIQALIEEGIAGEKIVTGQDADLAACRRIMRGTQSMTVYKPLKKLAEMGAEVAFKVATGQPVDAPESINNGMEEVPAIYEAVIAVDRENMMETVVADGFHTAAELE